MRRLFKARSDPAKGPFLPLLVPGLGPGAGAHAVGHLAGRLALFFAALLRAQQPLVVQVPAVQRLVRRRKALVAGRRAHGLDLVEARQLGGRQCGGQFGRENL